MPRPAFTQIGGERAVVLGGEQLGGRHHGGLGAALGDGGHGHEGDDGLAGADVALDQPRHPLGGGEVVADILDGEALALGEGVGQGGGDRGGDLAGEGARDAAGRDELGADDEQRELAGEIFVVGEAHAVLRPELRIIGSVGGVRGSHGGLEGGPAELGDALGRHPLGQLGQGAEDLADRA